MARTSRSLSPIGTGKRRRWTRPAWAGRSRGRNPGVLRVGSPSPILGDPTASFPELGAGFDGFGGPPSVKGVSCPSNGLEPSGGVLGPPGRASSFPPGKAAVQGKVPWPFIWPGVGWLHASIGGF